MRRACSARDRDGAAALRDWRDEDRAPFAAMSASPAVMAHLGGPATPDQADAAIARVRAHQAAHGFSFWAIERLADAAFLGFCGLKRVTGLGASIEGGIEIGWRLHEDAWGRGYAQAAPASPGHGRTPMRRAWWR